MIKPPVDAPRVTMSQCNGCQCYESTVGKFMNLPTVDSLCVAHRRIKAKPGELISHEIHYTSKIIPSKQTPPKMNNSKHRSFSKGTPTKD